MFPAMVGHTQSAENAAGNTKGYLEKLVELLVQFSVKNAILISINQIVTTN